MPSDKIKFTLDAHFIVLGIISEIPIYALAADLNKKLGYSLAWTKEYMIDNKIERQQTLYNRFIQKGEEKELEILLISNLFKDFFLFKKYKDFTSFLLFNSNNLFKIEDLKGMSQIILAKEFKVSEIRGIEIIWENSNSI